MHYDQVRDDKGNSIVFDTRRDVVWELGVMHLWRL